MATPELPGYLAKKATPFLLAWSHLLARVLPKPKRLPVTIVRGRDGRVLSAETGQLLPEDVEKIASFLCPDQFMCAGQADIDVWQ